LKAVFGYVSRNNFKSFVIVKFDKKSCTSEIVIAFNKWSFGIICLQINGI